MDHDLQQPTSLGNISLSTLEANGDKIRYLQAKSTRFLVSSNSVHHGITNLGIDEFDSRRQHPWIGQGHMNLYTCNKSRCLHNIGTFKIPIS